MRPQPVGYQSRRRIGTLRDTGNSIELELPARAALILEPVSPLR
jgi:hypothetical protein